MDAVDKTLGLVGRRPGQATVMERDGAAELCSRRGMAGMMLKTGVRTCR